AARAVATPTAKPVATPVAAAPVAMRHRVVINQLPQKFMPHPCTASSEQAVLRAHVSGNSINSVHVNRAGLQPPSGQPAVIVRHLPAARVLAPASGYSHSGAWTTLQRPLLQTASASFSAPTRVLHRLTSPAKSIALRRSAR
ncbi:MDR1, partial [Symbiodinium necroappetens]